MSSFVLLAFFALICLFRTRLKILLCRTFRINSSSSGIVRKWHLTTEFHLFISCSDFIKEVLGAQKASFLNDGRVVGSLFSSYLIGHSGPTWNRLRNTLHKGLRLSQHRFAGTFGRIFQDTISNLFLKLTDSKSNYFALSQIKLFMQEFQLQLFIMFTCNITPSNHYMQQLLQAYAELDSGLTYRFGSYFPYWFPTPQNRAIWKASNLIQNYFRDLILTRSSASVTERSDLCMLDIISNSNLQLGELVDNIAGFSLAAEDSRAMLSLVECLALQPRWQNELYDALRGQAWHYEDRDPQRISQDLRSIPILGLLLRR